MEKIQHFSIRKLSIGAASVLIGISFLGVKASTVKADALQNPSETELAKPKVANEAIKQDTGSNIEQEPASDIKQDTSSNIKQEPTSDIKQELVSKTDAKQITNNQPNAAQTPVKPASPKPNLNQQNAADLEAKPQTPVKDKLQTNSVIIPDKAGQSKVKVTNLMAIAGKKLNAQMLSESKVMTPAKDTNGGFDEATWGKLNVNDWKGSVQGDYYQLTSYTGDADHVIVPNEADFEKAGISTSGKQVGVTSDLMKSIRDSIYDDGDGFAFASNGEQTVAFSKTGNKQIKALNSDWSNTWSSMYLENMKKITQFDGSSLDVSGVTNMRTMFEYVANIDLSSLSDWDVSNVVDMLGMFNHAHVNDLSPFAKWDVSKVTDMNSMFSLGYISDLSPLANWDVSKVTDMRAMFSYCQQISDLSPLANWKVDNVTDMGQMFIQSQISDLSPLANWKVDNVRNMQGMFESNQIGNLSPLANWQVGNVGDMSHMFESNQIGDLSPLANWKVNNVTNMSSMFDDNTGSKTKTATAKRIIDFVYPAGYTGKKQDLVTQTVDVPQKVSVTLTTKESKPSNNILDWVTTAETPEASDPVYFQDYTVPEIKGLLEPDKLSIAGLPPIDITDPDKAVISGLPANPIEPMYATVTYKLVESNTNDAFALDPKNGLHEHANVNNNGGYDEDYWGKLNINDWNYTTNDNTITITGYKGNNQSSLIIPNGADFDLANGQGTEQSNVEISSNVMHDLAKNATRIGLSKTANKKVIAGNAIWHDAFGGMTNKPGTDSNAYGGIKYGSPNLTQMDLHNLDTAAITDMSTLFNGGSNLTTVGDLSEWNTSNVTNMRAMFQTASNLTNIGNLDNWDTRRVTDMTSMFGDATNLTNIGDLSKWQTGNVTNMHSMFSNATNLTNIGNLDNWDTSKVTDMSWIFGTDTGKQSHLTNIGDLSKWQTGNVTDMNNMFANATSLTNIGNLDNWDTSKVTDMSWMFNGASSLTSLDVSKWDTSNVTNMSYMFSGASSLTSLDVSKWDTGNVTNMSNMFNGARSLASLDVSNWDTGNVTDMYSMFNGASSLTSLDVSNWDTGKVTDMHLMFDGASSLTNLEVSNWDTSKVTNMSLMFSGASRLTSLDVSKWDTGKVTDMSWMFNGASSLKSLDVSNWDTSKVTNMSDMFSYDPKLALIANSGKFADYLVKNNFADSRINSDVKSVTTDNTKLLQLLTNDSQHDSATRTITFTFPANYSPDLTKYHLIKVGSTYQIKQSADYDKPYLQGTVLINATDDITKHHIDTTKPYKLSDTWQPNYDKLVLAHKNSDGSVSFDAIQLPQIPGYKAVVKTASSPVNPARARFAVSFMALPKPVKSVPNDTKPAETVSPATPVAIEVAKPIKTEPKVATTPKVIDLSNDAVATTPKETIWQVADEPDQDTYHVSNGQYAVELPHISNAQLHVIANDSTKDSILFTYKGQKAQYVFKIKFVNGHYLLTTYKIKSGKLVKLIDYNFTKSSRMSDVILDWLQFN